MLRNAVTGLDAILEQIAEVRDAKGISGLLERIARGYGLKTVAYLGTGTLDRRVPRREPYIAVTYAPAWVERYRVRGYLKIDPAIQIGLRRLLPIDWDELGRGERDLRQFFGEALEFGLGRRGISFPVHGCRADRGLFSVTADFNNREWYWARRTAFRHFPIIAAHLHEAVLRTDGVFRARPHLSPRELECLRWTSEGKTVWECGVILGLSLHTVRCYLESARHKLGASSNTHAVSLAHESGLLLKVP
ncbi:LuxR family transcriptional regulator [Mesorhizobium sp. M5C.F.Ca.IN.020.14.1.1]|nr:LuxR family transcriptional regulator [Mesorhizobium sp. M5C.F.Ca.IN.020.14.1.1]